MFQNRTSAIRRVGGIPGIEQEGVDSGRAQAPGDLSRIGGAEHPVFLFFVLGDAADHLNAFPVQGFSNLHSLFSCFRIVELYKIGPQIPREADDLVRRSAGNDAQPGGRGEPAAQVSG